MSGAATRAVGGELRAALESRDGGRRGEAVAVDADADDPMAGGGGVGALRTGLGASTESGRALCSLPMAIERGAATETETARSRVQRVNGAQNPLALAQAPFALT